MAQVHVTSNLRIRRSFGKIKKIIEIPNLIEIQKRSYDDFLQVGVSTEDRADVGLQAVFKSVFPIKDFNETASLEFVSYELGTPKYDVEECHQRGMTYAAPLKVKIQLVIWDVENGRRSIKNVKEQEVYFGEIPLMTGNGTFMVNGTERVIVSQLHRSPECSSSTTRAAPIRPASCSTRRESFRIAGAGSISNSTRATCSTSESTDGASFRRPCCCARSG
jgi:DNA-directed RNA polymerase beta subunit